MKLILLALAAASVADQGPIASEMLAAHNGLRETVHVPLLAWSDELAVVAQDWANTLERNGQFQHSKNKNGENLAEFRGGAPSTARQAFDLWAAEAKYYDREKNRCTGGACLHYTQIVWGNTREVGCAVARSRQREVWVCEYFPPGNYVGRRPY